MHLETLIEEVGAFGPYQILCAVTIGFMKAALCTSFMIMGFCAYEPDWWCVSGDHGLNQSNFTMANGTFKNCNWNGTCQRQYSGNEVTVVTEWDLVCESKWIASIMTTSQYVGILIGGLITGYVSDSYGRKKVIYGGLVIAVVGQVIAAFSNSWLMFTAFRTIIGIGLAFGIIPMYPYLIEFVGKRWRVIISSIPDWGIGMIVLSLLAWWLKNWKWLHLASAAFMAPLIPTYFYMDESVRWLVVQGRLSEARRVINKMAAINRKPVPDTSILELIAEEERGNEDTTKKYTYLDLFKTRKMILKTLLISFTWFSFSIIYYGIYFGVKDFSGDLYINMLLFALTELLLTPLTIFFFELFRRKQAFIITTMICCAACFGVVVCSRVDSEDMGAYVNGLSNTAKEAIVTSWVIMEAFGAEQFPTVIRSQACAAQYTGARIGGLLSAQIFLLGDSGDLMPPFLFLGILAFLTALAVLPLEETKGRPLQDIMIEVKEDTHKQTELETKI